MTRVLIVGDSQAAGPPGRALAHLLEAQGATVTLEGRVGWGLVRWWSPTTAGGSPLLRLLDQRWDTIVYMFGSNDTPSNAFGTAVETAYNYPATRDLWYVGAPVYDDPDQNARARQLDVVARHRFGRRFIDSTRMTTVDQGRTPDATHFTVEGGRRWAGQILAAMETRRGPSTWVVAAVAILGTAVLFLLAKD